MKKRILGMLVLWTILLTSCKNDDGNTNGGIEVTVKISGFVELSDNAPAESVEVSIDNVINLTTTTNTEGYFQIEGVVKGEHDLYILKEEIDSDLFIQKIFSINLDSDTEITSTLSLPNPVDLYEPSDITDSSALISWNPSESEDFVEYNLYRHSSSEFDATTATLVHVSSARNETSFLDEDLNSSEDYYYRVYVLGEMGQIGGSNVFNLRFENDNILNNGSFEESDPLLWALYTMDAGTDIEASINNIEVVDTEFYVGSKSLEFYTPTESGCWELFIVQNLGDNVFVPDATYRFSFYYKAKDFIEMAANLWIFLRNYDVEPYIYDSNDITDYTSIDFFGDNQWRLWTHEFTLPSEFAENDHQFSLDFCVGTTGTWWIDDLKMVRID